MSTNSGLSKCCISGKVHEGAPVGKVEQVGGLPTYVSEPSNKSKAKSIIFLTDIFGWEFQNVRLLADNYAQAGFYVYVPDVLEGDALPKDFLQDIEPRQEDAAQLTMVDKAKKTANVGATFGPWMVKHREAVAKPIIDGFIDSVRKIPGTGKVGAIGFCWGGRYAILAAHGGPGGVDATVAYHPAMLSIPADVEHVSKPLSVAFGTNDSLVDEKARNELSENFKGRDFPHEIQLYEDQIHGFALRSDWSHEKEKKAMDDAEKQGVEWLNKYL